MRIDFPHDLAAIVARAFQSGCETSIRELSEHLALQGESTLSAAVHVVNFVESFDLEMIPAPFEGEFDTARILRSKDQTDNALRKISTILDSGEGPSVEFKSSMFCSMRDWHAEGKRLIIPGLEGEILKTICAFLNTDGGDLLIGVADDGQVCEGIKLDQEVKQWTVDRWQLHFRSLVESRFHDGPHIQQYLRTAMVEISGLPVFHVDVLARTTPSFVRRAKNQPAEFFVRNGPRSDSLDLPTFYAHLTSVHRTRLI